FMSDDPTQQPELFSEEPQPVAKKAAKKAAKSAKKAAKKAVKKAAKKTAKKAAKKAVKKASAKSKTTGDEVRTGEQESRGRERGSDQAVEGSVGENGPKETKVRTKRAAEAKPLDGREERGETQREANVEGQATADLREEEAPRYGRVPGGGPVERGEKEKDPRGREREKRRDRGERNDGGRRQGDGQPEAGRKRRRRRRRRGDSREGGGRGRSEGREDQEERPVVLEGPKEQVSGLLEMAPKGFGFLRLPERNFEQAKDDAFVSPDLVRKNGLRVGVWIEGFTQQGPRGPQLVEITLVNGMPPEEARKAPAFEELKAINPDKRISFETTQNRYSTRVVDLISPVARGQRGLIVSPPRSGKTTLLQHIAEAVQELHDETLHLMVLLVDERPEEVTEFRRALPGVEVYASSNDEHPRNHTRIAEIAIERAKRLVEAGQHVFLLMDSITRLARAYNGGMRSKGRGVGSGGIMVGALETPRRLFAAARNTREAGSLTILATALVQTNSRGDEAIFQEFKGTGNMELVLDRKIAENYIYPAVDIFKSGTRREELILPDHTLHKIQMIRRGLAGHRPEEAMERLLFFLKKFPNNPQMLLEIKG
ncbi:MAG: transcription termination factor Rho, partial [Verrucomicrobiales bacterium]